VNQFNDKVTVSDDEIDAYYQANQGDFQHPEQVNLEYVLLDAAALSTDVDLSEEAIKAYYQDHQAAYKAPEKRRVAHILVDLNKDNAEQEAADILAKVQQGEDFAELAKTLSSDTFSGENGGELDWFEKGVMDPDFEAAAFALANVGDTSAVVKSEFGYHVIKLLEVQANAAAPFEEVKDKIAKTLKHDKAMEVFYDKLQKLSEMAFEVPDTLTEAADAAELTVQQTGLFSRDTAAGDFANAQVLVPAFSADLREEQVNSEVIELSPEKVMVIRVNEFKPQSTKALAEVKDTITLLLTRDKATAAANEFVMQLMTALDKGEDITALLAPYDFSFSEPESVSRMAPGTSPEVARQVFTMAKPETGKVQRAKVALLNGDLALVELTGVTELPAETLPSEAETQQLSQFVQNTQADTSYQALLKLLQARADISYPVVEQD
jgi:peptidyl-prolyl cis-trans isomerase D